MQKVEAKFKYVRISPLKLRRIANLVRGKICTEALALLRSLPNKGARVIEKAVKSASANAKNNHKLDPARLKIIEIFVDSAGMLRRFRAKSRGRVGPIKKRISHLSVRVGEA